MKKLIQKNKMDSETEEVIYRYPEDTIDGFRYEEKYDNKRKDINEIEYKRRLLIVEKRCNEEKEDYKRDIYLAVTGWGVDNGIYVKELLKKISNIDYIKKEQ